MVVRMICINEHYLLFNILRSYIYTHNIKHNIPTHKIRIHNLSTLSNTLYLMSNLDRLYMFDIPRKLYFSTLTIQFGPPQ